MENKIETTKKYIAEYIWFDSKNNFRHKTRVITMNCVDNTTLTDFPEWNYDGSSTNQATTGDSEIVLKPVYYCVDPFRCIANSYLVLCDMYDSYNYPIENNTRSFASEVFNQRTDLQPWFGIEQEYFIVDPKKNKPLGFPETQDQLNITKGEFYCKMGVKYGRELAEEHLRLCIKAGLNLSGMNAEVAPGQWEYQVGPCEGINAADQLMVSRFILEQLADKMNLKISYNPKFVMGDCNGSGCHTNFSTKYMREGKEGKTGLEFIYNAIDKLSEKHKEHMQVYGAGNEKRMTGKNETSDYNTFTYGIASRNTSVRIGNKVLHDKCGYFEDRRPASNMNPYLVTAMIFQTCCL
jgi:glutamine synthetase